MAQCATKLLVNLLESRFVIAKRVNAEVDTCRKKMKALKRWVTNGVNRDTLDMWCF